MFDCKRKFSFALLLMSPFFLLSMSSSSIQAEETAADSEVSGAYCSAPTRNIFGQEPVGVLLNIAEGELGSIEALAGGCICSNGLQKLFYYPQLSCDVLSCGTSFVNGFVACQNYSELCVLGANGEFYKPSSEYPNYDVYALIHLLCDNDIENCQPYVGIWNFLQNVTGIALRSESDGHIIRFADNIFPTPIGPISGLLPFTALSCHGCQSISGDGAGNCEGIFKEGVIN